MSDPLEGRQRLFADPIQRSNSDGDQDVESRPHSTGKTFVSPIHFYCIPPPLPLYSGQSWGSTHTHNSWTCLCLSPWTPEGGPSPLTSGWVQPRVVGKRRICQVCVPRKRFWRVVRLLGTVIIPTVLRSTKNDLEGFKFWSERGENEGKFPFPSVERNPRIDVPSRVETLSSSMCGCLIFCGGPRKSFNPSDSSSWRVLFSFVKQDRYTHMYMFTKMMIMESATRSVWT